jgi:hypothetical protein
MVEFQVIHWWWLSHELMRLETGTGDPSGWNFEVKMTMEFADYHFKLVPMGDAAKLPFGRIKAEVQKFELLGHYTSDVRQELRALRDGVQVELGKLDFAFLSPPTGKYFEQEKLFGDLVYDKIEEARQDVKDAGNCLAAGLPTACVFHLMRTAEFGLRKIAAKVGVKLKIKGKRQPIEFATWGEVIQGIKTALASVRTLPHGSRKNRKLQFYSDAAEHCTYIKDVWRNEVSHTRKRYAESEALEVMQRLRHFMSLLAVQD